MFIYIQINKFMNLCPNKQFKSLIRSLLNKVETLSAESTAVAVTSGKIKIKIKVLKRLNLNLDYCLFRFGVDPSFL